MRPAKIHARPKDDSKGVPEGLNPYAQYLRDLVRNGPPLLTRAQEIRIAKALEEQILLAADEMRKDIQAADASLRNPKATAASRQDATDLVARLNPLGLKPRLLLAHLFELLRGPDGEVHFTQYARPDGLRLQQHLVESNLRLVVSLSRKFGGGAMPIVDLVSEGNLGLMHAALRFDHRRGVRFSTYAAWWIRHAITRAISDRARLIRLPVHMIEFSTYVNKTRLRLTTQRGRPATDEEVARALTGIAKHSPRLTNHAGDGMTSMLAKIRALNLQVLFPSSLDMPRRDEDGDIGTLYDGVAAPQPEAPEFAELVQGSMHDLLSRAMQQLSPIELDVIKLRFLDDDTKVFREIGDKYHLSRERIRQIEAVALKKLRRDARLKDAYGERAA